MLQKCEDIAGLDGLKFWEKMQVRSSLLICGWVSSWECGTRTFVNQLVVKGVFDNDVGVWVSCERDSDVVVF